jgi:peroxiredoxin
MSLKPWTSWVLAAAGFYQLAWAAAAALEPQQVQQLLGLERVQPSALWSAVIWALALGGAALLIACTDPAKQWAIVLLSMLAKLGALVGVANLVSRGEAPVRMFVCGIANDAAWLPLLGAVLYEVHEATLGQRRNTCPDILNFALRTRTNHGESLDEMSYVSPVLLVFLRHLGCPFCREALDDLSARRKEIEENGARLVVVYMNSDARTEAYFAKGGLAGVARICDPRRCLYRAFGLRRGSLRMLIGPKVWLRAIHAVMLRGLGLGRLRSDLFQMPGVFLLFYGEVIRSYRHQHASDRPDYLAIVTGQTQSAEELTS